MKVFHGPLNRLEDVTVQLDSPHVFPKYRSKDDFVFVYGAVDGGGGLQCFDESVNVTVDLRSNTVTTDNDGFRVFYGVSRDDKECIEVTKICYHQAAARQPRQRQFTIPASDKERDLLFTDPSYCRRKQVFVEKKIATTVESFAFYDCDTVTLNLDTLELDEIVRGDPHISNQEVVSPPQPLPPPPYAEDAWTLAFRSSGLRISYGTSLAGSLDVTEVCLRDLRVDDTIVVPQMDKVRDCYFTDPAEFCRKFVFVESGNVVAVVVDDDDDDQDAPPPSPQSLMFDEMVTVRIRVLAATAAATSVSVSVSVSAVDLMAVPPQKKIVDSGAGWFPRTVFMCHRDLHFIAKYSRNWRRLNPDYDVLLFDDELCRRFLLTHFSQEYVDLFEFLYDGPIKADFWRVCVVFVHGGLYVDADVEPLVPLHEFLESDVDFVTCTSYGPNFNPIFILARPGDAFLRRVVETYLHMYRTHVPYSYWTYSIMTVVSDLLQLQDYDKTDRVFVDAETGRKRYQILHEVSAASFEEDYCEYGGVKVFNNRYRSYDAGSHNFMY